MGEKRERQAALLKFSSEQPFSTQDEMVAKLQQAGFNATQSSISRDVRELGLVRVNGHYVAAMAAGAEASARGYGVLGNELIISAEPVGANLIVLKTPPGSASAVAVDLDKRELPGSAGTIAGDDTVFIAVHSRAAQGQLLSMLPNVIGRSHTLRVEVKLSAGDASDGDTNGETS